MAPNKSETHNDAAREHPSCRIGVVIVNYRTAELALRCVHSLAPSLDAVDARLVVVDNDSQDGSFETLSKCTSAPEFSGRLTVLAAGANGGFSAGNNIGIRSVEADWYLLLNADAAASANALEALAQAVQASDDVGIIAPRIVDLEGRRQVSHFRNHTLLSEFVDGVHTGVFTKLFPRAEIPILPEGATESADWVSFAAVLIRADAIRDVGPMDEEFFLYFEDCDYCRRIVDAGYTVAFAPHAEFRHDEGGSTGFGEKNRKAKRLPAYYYRARSHYFRKYYGPLGPLLGNLAWYAGRALAHARGLVGRPAPIVCENRAQDMWIGWR